jgi:hypothetical protein
MQIIGIVKDATGAIIGEGPLTSILNASVSRVLDGAGEVSVTVPLADARVTDLVQAERQITLRVYPGTTTDTTVVGRLEYTGCTFTASSEAVGHPADDAFDFDFNTYWQASAGQPQWAQVTFPTAQTVRGYTLARPSGATNGLPVNFTFEYWDGAAWQVADTRTGVTWSDTKHDYDLASPVTASEFRLNITSTILGANPKLNTLDITGDAPAESADSRDVGTGIIRALSGQVDSGNLTLTLSGPDELDLLKRENTLLNRLFTNVDTTDALDTLIALAAGWTIDHTGVTGTLYAKFDGVSVLKAIQDIAVQTGYHFRYAGGKAVTFGALADASGKRILQAGHALPQEAYSNTDVLFIERLTWDERSDEIANWIVPLGKGEGEASITLARSTRPGLLTEAFEVAPTNRVGLNYDYGVPTLIMSKYSQRFQIDAETVITYSQLNLYKIGAPTGTLTLRVETDNAGKASGNLVHANATATFDEADLPTSGAWITFNFAGSFTLSATTDYHLVISTSRAASGTNISMINVAEGYASGALWAFRASDSTWLDLTPYDALFRVFGSSGATAIQSTTGPDGKLVYYIKDDTSIAAYGQNERVVVFEGIAAQDNTEEGVIDAANQLYDAAAAWMADHLAPVVTYGCSVRNVRTNLLPGQTIPLVYRGLVYDTDGLTPIAFKDINTTLYITRVTENFSPSGDSTDLELSNVQRVKTSVAAQVASVLESSTIRAVASDPRIGYDPSTAGGRLSLTSATPVTTTDVTAATVLYYTPYKHNWITLWNNYRWMPYIFAEIPIALDGLAANTNFDVFAYDYNGVVVLETVAWANATTRATALVLQDGVYVKTGALTHKYLGTFRTTATAGQCEDSDAKRYVANYYNRVPRILHIQDNTSSWTYTTANTWRQARATASNKVEVVACDGASNLLHLTAHGAFRKDTASGLAAIGIGEDVTNADSASLNLTGRHNYTDTDLQMPLSALLEKYTPQGYHAYNWLEWVFNNGATFYGSSAGIRTHGLHGWIEA